MDFLYFSMACVGAATAWHVSSGAYLASRWKAQDYANRWMRADNARRQKELNKERDAYIKRLIRDDTIIQSSIEKSVARAVEKALKKYLKKLESA